MAFELDIDRLFAFDKLLNFDAGELAAVFDDKPAPPMEKIERSRRTLKRKAADVPRRRVTRRKTKDTPGAPLSDETVTTTEYCSSSGSSSDGLSDSENFFRGHGARLPSQAAAAAASSASSSAIALPVPEVCVDFAPLSRCETAAGARPFSSDVRSAAPCNEGIVRYAISTRCCGRAHTVVRKFGDFLSLARDLATEFTPSALLDPAAVTDWLHGVLGLQGVPLQPSLRRFLEVEFLDGTVASKARHSA